MNTVAQFVGSSSDVNVDGIPSAAVELERRLRPESVRGYSRAEVDRYLAALAKERARLEREIDEARRRIERARYHLGAREVLLSMLAGAISDVTSKQRNAGVLGAAPTPAAIETSEREIRWRARALDAPAVSVGAR